MSSYVNNYKTVLKSAFLKANVKQVKMALDSIVSYKDHCLIGA